MGVSSGGVGLGGAGLDGRNPLNHTWMPGAHYESAGGGVPPGHEKVKRGIRSLECKVEVTECRVWVTWFDAEKECYSQRDMSI